MNTDQRPTLPNFLVIGAMKAGTTSLYQYLRAHPDVFMSSPKELHFFSARRGNDLEWYEAHFAAAGTATAVGEASASYTTYPDSEGVPERIADVVPDAHLIYLVRDPIDRMRSHYLHRLGAGKETSSIEQALTEDPIYVRTSRYAERIDRYLQHFPRDQLLIVRSEDLRASRDSTLHDIFRFLEVDPLLAPADSTREFYRTTDKRVPRRTAQVIRRSALARALVRRMPSGAAKLGRRIATEEISPAAAEVGPVVRAELEDLLRDDVVRLRALIGNGFDGWGIA